MIGLEAQDAPLISAKTGLNVKEVLEQIVTKIPAPAGDPEAPLQALILIVFMIRIKVLLFSAGSRTVV